MVCQENGERILQSHNSFACEPTCGYDFHFFIWVLFTNLSWENLNILQLLSIILSFLLFYQYFLNKGGQIHGPTFSRENLTKSRATTFTKFCLCVWAGGTVKYESRRKKQDITKWDSKKVYFLCCFISCI